MHENKNLSAPRRVGFVDDDDTANGSAACHMFSSDYELVPFSIFIMSRQLKFFKC